MEYSNRLFNKRNKESTSLRQILIEYLSRSQVQGYKFIVQTDRPLYEKVLWIFITIFGIGLTFWLVINSYFQFLESPTVTSEDPTRTSVLELSFPAITVCNSNRISRKALMEYSKFILNATKDEQQNIGRTVDEIFKNLLLIGQMYTMEATDDMLHKVEMIHDVLIGINVYDGTYPIYEIMSKLAPTCVDTLKACKWQGHHVDCMKIFTTRKTFMGPCCIFNYRRPVVSILTTQQQFNHTIPAFKKPERVNSHGSDFGLTFRVAHELNDYAWTMNDYTGIVVLISDSQDYPDQESGAVREKIISPQQEVFVSLYPTLIRGSRSMKTFNVSSRNCVFNDEINLVFANFYSLSECLLTCRISKIIELCGCTPPQVTNLFNSSSCTLSDLGCLNRWRIDWYNQDDQSLEHRSHCPACTPKCNRIEYVVYTSESNFDPQEAKKRSHDPKFMNLTDISNQSIVYVNFGTNRIRNYDQTASYVWYDLLANLGAVGCLSLGATIVSIIEIIYFFSGKLGAICIRKRLHGVGRIKSKFDYVN